MTFSVVIAEDHPMFREGLRALLEANAQLSVVAAVDGGRLAALAVQEFQADVAVLDLSMPDGDGIEATKAIRQEAPDTRILVLTSYDTEKHVSSALAAGANGYVLKSAQPNEIVEAVLATAAGSAVLSDAVLATVANGAARGSARMFPELTERETEVLTCLADGSSNEEIGKALGLSSKTVRNYVSNILVKLAVRDRPAAVVEARRRGLGS